MITKTILSLQHSLIKHLVALRKNAKYRKEHKSVLIVGKKMVYDLKDKIPFKTIITSNPDEKINISAEILIKTSVEGMKKITGLNEPEDIAAEVSFPKSLPLKPAEKILILDRISDPGNMGTLIRSALALNWDRVIITHNSVDPFNEKALRAAKGATFLLPITFSPIEELQPFIKENSIHLYIADIEGQDITTSPFKKPLALVLSNESKGISSWTKDSSYHPLTIPMNKAIDSLNVAISGGILMYAIGEKL